MTRNGERLEENRVLCQATIFGIEQFPSERIYVTSTQKCSHSIFLKKKKQRYMYLGYQMTRHSFHSSSGLLSTDIEASFMSLLCTSQIEASTSPPRATPGHLYFSQNFCSNSPQMPHHRSIPGDQMPPPPGNFSVVFIMLRKLCV